MTDPGDDSTWDELDDLDTEDVRTVIELEAEDEGDDGFGYDRGY